jgi:hypothetical protein
MWFQHEPSFSCFGQSLTGDFLSAARPVKTPSFVSAPPALALQLPPLILSTHCNRDSLQCGLSRSQLAKELNKSRVLSKRKKSFLAGLNHLCLRTHAAHKPYIDQAVGTVWDVMNMIHGTEERAAVKSVR